MIPVEERQSCHSTREILGWETERGYTMPITIKGRDYAVKDVFSDSFYFEIPHYQRPYAWGEDHAIALVDDLTEAMNRHSLNGSGPDPYFLGSVVLIKTEDNQHAWVVDGQQRLTTLTILLAVIRDLAKGQSLSKDIEPLIMERGNRVTGTKNRFRLAVRERDREFFMNHIQAADSLEPLFSFDEATLSDPRKNMRNNAWKIREKLKNASLEELEQLAGYLSQRCSLVVVSTPDMGSAYRIFSVLNDRGMQLTHSDILKANIIGKIPDHEQDPYSKKWEDLEDMVGRDEFKDLFSHIRTIIIKKKAQNVLREFQEDILPKLPPKQFIDNLVKPHAEAFDQIIHASFESTTNAEAINQKLRWLNQIDNFDWMPPAILFLATHLHESDKILAFLKGLDRLASAMLIMRSNVNYRIERYAGVITSIEEGTVLSEVGSSLDLTEDEKKATRESLNADVYTVRAIVKYVLLRLDEKLSSGEATYNHATISVEHVLPQSPNPRSQWMEWFSNDEDREFWTHKLANLVLLNRRKNSEARNFEFDKKKKTYFTTDDQGSSPFTLTSQVIGATEWTPEVLEERQKHLVRKLESLWALKAQVTPPTQHPA